MNTHNPASGEGHKLRHTFIAMLFAFVVSVLATKAVDLLTVVTSDWESEFSLLQVVDNFLYADGLLIVPFVHLLLAFLLVSMSWVMWSRSQSSGLAKQIDSFISIPFLILLVEMLLVVLYFALTSTVEQDISSYNSSKKIEDFVKNPSVQPEAQVLAFVFFIWFLWDVISDVIASPRAVNPTSITSRLLSPIQGVLTYTSTSFFCLLACIVVSHVADSTSSIKIIWADMALGSVLIWFRPAKKIEYFLVKFFPAERTRNNTRHDHSLSKIDIFWFITPVISFLVCLYFASGVSLCHLLQ